MSLTATVEEGWEMMSEDRLGSKYEGIAAGVWNLFCNPEKTAYLSVVKRRPRPVLS